LKPIIQVITYRSSAPLVKFVGALPNLDDSLPFSLVVQSAVLIYRLWCVSVPDAQLDTNLMPKRGSTGYRYTDYGLLVRFESGFSMSGLAESGLFSGGTSFWTRAY
jgi:hypothetical protein